MKMLPRERVAAAVEFKRPDRIPVQVHASPGGLYEHGRKLLDLMRLCPNDFGDMSSLELPNPPPTDFDPDGSYHRFDRDHWGTEWEYRIFGIAGHPVKVPFESYDALGTYRPPQPPPLEGPDFEAACADGARHREKYYHCQWVFGVWEQMHFLRPYEDCMYEIMDDSPEINRVADIVADYVEGCVNHYMAIGCDAIVFGDDFGTQLAPIFPPAVWKRFFRPRYERLFAPVRKAGRKIFFHSCGQIGPILEDFAEMGVNAVWPQLQLFDQRDLARRCRGLGLAVQLHPERGSLMQQDPPEKVREYVSRLLENFASDSGGSWLYLEVDPGFKRENVEALFDCAMKIGRIAG